MLIILSINFRIDWSDTREPSIWFVLIYCHSLNKNPLMFLIIVKSVYGNMRQPAASIFHVVEIIWKAVCVLFLLWWYVYMYPCIRLPNSNSIILSKWEKKNLNMFMYHFGYNYRPRCSSCLCVLPLANDQPWQFTAILLSLLSSSRFAKPMKLNYSYTGIHGCIACSHCIYSRVVFNYSLCI